MMALPRRPASLLMVAPHPDDETIGAHALMTRLRRRGVIVHVLVVSDGRASHPGSARWPWRRLVRERQRETRLALRRIGVPATNITFLGLPDGQLHAHVRSVRRGVARAATRLTAPSLALAPAPTDHHPDHRVVAAAAHAARLPGVRWCAYPVWPAGQRLPGARALRLTTQERLAKRHAVRAYRTQTGMIADDPDGFALTRAQIDAFTRPQEWFAEYRR